MLYSLKFPTYIPKQSPLFDEHGNCTTCGNPGVAIPGFDMVCDHCPPTPLSDIISRTDNYEPNRLTKSFIQFVKICHEKMLYGFFHKNRTGWDDLSWTENQIKNSIIEHIKKDDPRDVAILAMFWWYRKQQQTSNND